MRSERREFSVSNVSPALQHVSDRYSSREALGVFSGGVSNRLSLERAAPNQSAESDFRAPVGGIAKRLMDVAIAGTALVALSPAFGLLAMLVRATSGKGVLYGHTRVGFDGRPFRCYKFRTMRSDGDEVLKAHLAADPDAAKEWRETFKLRNDPRITFIGRFLRKSSLDELPQLVNHPAHSDRAVE